MAIFYVKNVLSSGDFSIFATKLTQKQLRIVQHRLIIKLFAYPH